MTAKACIALACVGLAGLLLWRTYGVLRRWRVDGKRFALMLAGTPPDPADPAGESVPLPAFLRARLRQAGLQASPGGLMAACIVLFLPAVLVAAATDVASGLLSCLAGLLIGWLFLNYRAAQRLRQLSDAMPGFLERLRQSLSVGNSLPGALARAVESAPPVVADCFAPALRRVAHGGGVTESLERCAAEFDLYELHLLAAAARTNLRFGGSLTAILRGMVDNIRRRAGVERQLRADTTQIRASAWVLGLLPLLVAALVMFSNRGYARWFLDTPQGHRMIGFCAVFQLAGAWCMRCITRVRY